MANEPIAPTEYNNILTGMDDARNGRGLGRYASLPSATAGAVTTASQFKDWRDKCSSGLTYTTNPINFDIASGSVVYREHLLRMDQVKSDWANMVTCASCSDVCVSTCKSGCGGCGSCGTGCSGGCNGCSGCGGCSGNCYNCSGGLWCVSCFGCTGCGGCRGCGGCDNSCGSNCAGCNGCSNTCYNGCNSNCQSGCKNACGSGCTSSARHGAL